MKIILFSMVAALLGGCFFGKRNDVFPPVQKLSESKYYRDYNIFERKGIGEINNKLRKLPFFEVYESSDTTLGLEIHTGEGSKKIAIPKGDQILYGYCDINDGPPHIFTRFFKDKIVQFRYSYHPYKLKEDDSDSIPLYKLLPDEIEIITEDTLFTYSGDYLIPFPYESLDDAINYQVSKDSIDYYAVYPFEVDMDTICKPHFILNRDENGKWWLDGKEYQYGDMLPKRFEFWKYYHDITMCFYF